MNPNDPNGRLFFLNGSITDNGKMNMIETNKQKGMILNNTVAQDE